MPAPFDYFWATGDKKLSPVAVRLSSWPAHLTGMQQVEGAAVPVAASTALPTSTGGKYQVPGIWGDKIFVPRSFLVGAVIEWRAAPLPLLSLLLTLVLSLFCCRPPALAHVDVNDAKAASRVRERDKKRRQRARAKAAKAAAAARAADERAADDAERSGAGEL